MPVWLVDSLADLHVDGLVQDCSNSSALAMELLQSSTKPSMCYLHIFYPVTYHVVEHYFSFWLTYHMYDCPSATEVIPEE